MFSVVSCRSSCEEKKLKESSEKEDEECKMTAEEMAKVYFSHKEEEKKSLVRHSEMLQFFSEYLENYLPFEVRCPQQNHQSPKCALSDFEVSENDPFWLQIFHVEQTKCSFIALLILMCTLELLKSLISVSAI